MENVSAPSYGLTIIQDNKFLKLWKKYLLSKIILDVDADAKFLVLVKLISNGFVTDYI